MIATSRCGRQVLEPRARIHTLPTRIFPLDTTHPMMLRYRQMAFFWSNRSNSVAGIWKRSARYWITSYVGNCLFGPPGWRRGSRRLERVERAWSAEGYTGTPDDIAYQVGYDTGVEGTEKGWSREKILRVGHQRAAQVLGRPIRRDLSNERAVTDASQARPPAVARSGGLRGGARQWK